MNGDLVTPERQRWAERIADGRRDTVESIFAVGRLLGEAKGSPDLPHGDFEAMIEADLPFKPSTARRLMAIARNPWLVNRAHGHVLPPSWRTLYELSRLTEEVLCAVASCPVFPRANFDSGLTAGRSQSNLQQIRIL